MIDTKAEEMIGVKTAALLFPAPAGNPVKEATVRTWMLRGVRGIRLESFRSGNHVLTSREAVQRFIDRMNDRANKVPVTSKPPAHKAPSRKGGRR